MMDIVILLKKYVNNEKINIFTTEDDIELLFEQSLQTLLYPLTNNKEYKKYYVSWVLKQEEFYNLQNELTELFNKNKIKHVYFKGSIISKVYDDPSVRTRGDIDIYVSPDNIDKAKKILIDNGYKLDEDIIDCMHHFGFKKNGIEVELHFNMFDPDCDKSWIKIFNNPFALSDNINESLYEFKPTYHLLYCIMHFARHLRHGAGIRYILDFYYMFNKTNIDFDLLHELVNKCNLNTLYSNIINAIRLIFDVDYDSSINKQDVTFFIDYMLKYGIHGNSNNETTIMASHDNKKTYFISRVFLTNKNYRITRYPKLGKHWYLYPICLIKHWLFLITHKFSSFFKFLFGKNKNKDLYKRLGI